MHLVENVVRSVGADRYSRVDISPILEACPRNVFFKYMAGSVDLQTVFLLEQFWRNYSPAWRDLPGIDY